MNRKARRRKAIIAFVCTAVAICAAMVAQALLWYAVINDDADATIAATLFAILIGGFGAMGGLAWYDERVSG